MSFTGGFLKLSEQLFLTNSDDTLLFAEAYLESSRTSTMKNFCKNSWLLLPVNYFHKKAPSYMFD